MITVLIRSCGLLLIVMTFAACEQTLTPERATLDDVEGDVALAGPASNPAAVPVAAFSAAAGEFPEGIAIDRGGTVFVGMSGLGEIWMLGADSTPSVFATVALTEGDTGVLGLEFDRRGYLFAAVSSADPDVNGVWRFAPSGEGHHIAGTEKIGLPNDLAFDPRGNLYITDSAAGSIWRVDRRGETEEWVQDPLLEGTGAFGLPIPIGANGIVYIPGHHSTFSRGNRGRGVGTFLVANTERGMLIRVPLQADGSAGTPTTLLDEPAALFGLDGIRADASGILYGVVNAQNQLVRLHGGVVVLVSDGLDFPASLAFGHRRGEQHHLYITNFALINDVDPMPGVVRVNVGPPGRGRIR